MQAQDIEHIAVLDDTAPSFDEENVVMENGKLNMSLVNAIAFDPYTHGYYKVTERVGEAFKDGLKLKK